MYADLGHFTRVVHPGELLIKIGIIAQNCLSNSLCCIREVLCMAKDRRQAAQIVKTFIEGTLLCNADCTTSDFSQQLRF